MRLPPGEAWLAWRAPEGPVGLRLREVDGGVEAEAWGAGAGAALERLAALVGEEDDEAGFVPRHAVVADLRARLVGLRIGRTGRMLDALVPAVLEQKVTSLEARRAWCRLVLALGEAAPGPLGLRLPPAPGRLAATPWLALHSVGVERRRAEVLRSLAASAPALERLLTVPAEAARAALVALPGVGRWTAAEATARSHGDPDAVPVGDLHLPHAAAWALAHEPRGSDARMLELLEPYRGHRGRVLRLIEAGGITAPRRGPRMPVRDLAAM